VLPLLCPVRKGHRGREDYRARGGRKAIRGHPQPSQAHRVFRGRQGHPEQKEIPENVVRQGQTVRKGHREYRDQQVQMAHQERRELKETPVIRGRRVFKVFRVFKVRQVVMQR
jgi:hypothetical protein